MIIHVVQQGDSIFSIANQYQTSIDQIVQVNALDQPEDLVIGQSLVIPTNTYTVQSGDSLYQISQLLGVSQQELANYNNINVNTPLEIGQVLQIPTPERTPITSNAYIEPTGDSVSQTLIQSARARAPFLTYMAPFSYQVNRDGTLIPPPLDNFPAIAAENNTALMLAVTNIEEGQFSEELGRLIVTDENVQNTLLDEVIRIANEVGYQDVHFDFEFLPPDTRENYNQFLRKAKQRLDENNLMLSTALAPKTSGEQTGQWYEAHDYQAHGEIVDFVVLMTYEWGYSYGPPMAVSPIQPVTGVVEYALSVMPAEKILLGQNLYGYDWTLPFEEGGEPAEAVSPNQAIQIARENNQAIEFDEEAQAPFFNYQDDQGNQHVVWFEDARSIQAKFDLIREHGLRGISYWKLGLAFPQNWYMLDQLFDIRKVRL
ncbi:LysM peptidoglycan-binding domain-containing protein [Tenuibacillus multivorans]|uniref:Spore germination protein n=1 Tax=Tenuibacillus multivorans TaxID=237069 RepID=A0A1G9W3U4_9BACI|nr:glycoside hydrolase family 18 protein [Tenuibacillus multivorans]GEL78289.1 spore germination protein YaaH [Tenuibacillus multivorans]SDM78735.1 spore germination protein [Tenuibacillus multivorans]